MEFRPRVSRHCDGRVALSSDPCSRRSTLLTSTLRGLDAERHPRRSPYGQPRTLVYGRIGSAMVKTNRLCDDRYVCNVNAQQDQGWSLALVPRLEMTPEATGA